MPKRKRVLSAAERKLAAEWQKILDASSKPLERGAKAKGVKAAGPTVTILSTSPHLSAADRQTLASSLPSVGDNKGSTAKKNIPKYTGTKMLGIGQLHKSNGVPIFQEEDAIHIAQMRRS